MKINTKYNSNYFWRIIFTIMVTVIHSNWLGEHHAGWYLCAEYFFIISGFFLIESFERRGETTFAYIGQKVMKLYPHHLLSFVPLFLWNYRVLVEDGSWKEIVHKLILHLGEALPFMYFFSDYGSIGGTFLNYPVWYISVLLLVSLGFYYLLSRHKSFFCSLFLPVTVFLVYRFFYSDCISINAASYKGIFINAFYLRGIGAMACGCMIYCIVKKLQQFSYTDTFFRLMRVLEVFFMVSVIVLSWFFADTKNDVYLMLLLCMGVTCSFIYPKKNMISGKVMKVANDLTFPVYLNHVFIFMVLNSGYISLPESFIMKYLLFMIMIIPYSFFTQWLVKTVMKKIKKLCRSFILSESVL